MWSSSFGAAGGSTDSPSSSSTVQNIAQYIEDYIDLVENVPNDVIRQVTQLHEHNHRYHQLLSQLESVMEVYTNMGTPKSDIGVNPPRAENDSNQESRRRKTLSMIQRCLIEIQEISDDKLFIVQTILEQLDGKGRQLDYDHRNVTVATNSPAKHPHYVNNTGGSNNVGTPVSSGGTNAANSTANNSNTSNTINDIIDASNMVDGGGEARDSSVSGGVGKETGGGGNSVHHTNHGVAAGTSNSHNSHSNAHNSSTTPSGKPRARRNLSAAKSVENNGLALEGGTATGGGSGSTSAGKRGAGPKKVAKGKESTKRTKKESANHNHSPPMYEEPPIDPDEPTYCLCEQVSYGEMIGCDNDNCHIEWFHFSCVALNAKPKGKWYCPNCRGDRSNIPKK